MGKKYGYVRVSTKEQNEDRQLIAMKEAGVEECDICMDKQSGKDFERPQYKQMIRVLRSGDTVFVKSIDRLGRNYNDIIVQWKLITLKKKADIVVLDMPILDTRRGKDLLGTFISDMVLALLSYVAENERINIAQRQAEGIEAAKMKGVRFGRKKKRVPKDFKTAVEKWMTNEISVREAAEMCGMAKSTFYDRVKEKYSKLKEQE